MVRMARLKVDAGKFYALDESIERYHGAPGPEAQQTARTYERKLMNLYGHQRQRTREHYDALDLHSATVYMMWVASSSAPMVLQVPDCNELHEPMRHAAMEMAP
jgi:hypothetical protein